jgi:hypothetical protein
MFLVCAGEDRILSEAPPWGVERSVLLPRRGSMANVKLAPGGPAPKDIAAATVRSA